MNDGYILQVKELKKYFPIKEGLFSKTVGNVKAVDGVSFDVKKGETFALVGESGCGKSTLARCILRILEPTEGEIIFKGKNILNLDEDKMKKVRRDIQIVFQDPYWSLNPRMLVKNIVAEPLKEHTDMKENKMVERVLELLNLMGLSDDHLRRYPHEFSGGQQQRIALARALALNPDLLVLDEPTSALDVSVQAQILNLLRELQERLDLTYVFISHDLSVIKYLADRIGIMYLGKIMEIGDKKEVFDSPLNPYTRALLSSIPEPDPTRKKEIKPLEGNVPDPSDPPKGCNFNTRCPYVGDICRREVPDLLPVDGRKVACHKIESGELSY
ncbi:MAG: ABC transporter ATP-binding protein, partial [Candidatus Saliniplasma sp.]